MEWKAKRLDEMTEHASNLLRLQLLLLLLLLLNESGRENSHLEVRFIGRANGDCIR